MRRGNSNRTGGGGVEALLRAKKSPNEGAFSDVVVVFHRKGAGRLAVDGSATSLLADLDRDRPQFGFTVVRQVNGRHGGQEDDG